jgi:hypothetical protein
MEMYNAAREAGTTVGHQFAKDGAGVSSEGQPSEPWLIEWFGEKRRVVWFTPNETSPIGGSIDELGKAERSWIEDHEAYHATLMRLNLESEATISELRAHLAGVQGALEISERTNIELGRALHACAEDKAALQVEITDAVVDAAAKQLDITWGYADEDGSIARKQARRALEAAFAVRAAARVSSETPTP